MLNISQDTRIVLKLGATDMRKSIHALSYLVEQEMKLNPFDNCMFVFCGKKKRLIKVLYWDKNGFCLWMKRLENDRFKWPKNKEEMLEINAQEMHWFLHGLDFTKAYKQKQFSRVS